MCGVNGRIARSRGVQLTLDQVDVADVQLSQNRVAMPLQAREKIAAAVDVF
jgi:hypothetical protein